MRGFIWGFPLGIGLPVWAQEEAGAGGRGVPWWVWLIVALLLVGAVYYAFKRRGRREGGG